MKNHEKRHTQRKDPARLPDPGKGSRDQVPIDASPAGEVEKLARDYAIAEVKRMFARLTGVESESLAEHLVWQMTAMQIWHPSDQSRAERTQSALEMLAALKPTSALETMLAVQMVGACEAALKFLANATGTGQTLEGANANVLLATRLMRLFTEQMEAMQKLKGKSGHQKVTVEHVHVYPGGQAIVGAVAPNPAGAGEGVR